MHKGFSLTLNGPNQTLQIPGKILLPLWMLTWPMVWTVALFIPRPTASNMYSTPPLAPLWPRMKVQSPDLPCVAGKSKTLCELEGFVWLLHQIHCNAVGRGAKAQLVVTKWAKTAICSKLLQTLPLQPKLGEREWCWSGSRTDYKV